MSIKLTSEEREGEKSIFDCVRFSRNMAVFEIRVCFLVVLQKTMVKFRRLEFVPRLRYFLFCNVLHMWRIQAIATYRVYDITLSCVLMCVRGWCNNGRGHEMHEPKVSALRSRDHYYFYPSAHYLKHPLPGKHVINVLFLDTDFQRS